MKLAQIFIILALPFVISCSSNEVASKKPEAKAIVPKQIAKKQGKRKSKSAVSKKMRFKKGKGPRVLQSSPVLKLQKRMAARLTDLYYYQGKGYIGEREDGLIGIRTTRGIGNKEKKRMKDRVKAENVDREKFYAIVAKSNKIKKKSLPKMREVFFKSYIKWTPIKSYYYTNGKWIQKK